MNDAVSTVPTGWTRVPLRDLVSTAGSQAKPWLTPDEAFNYVSLEDIEAGTGRILDLRPTLGRDIASEKTRFKRGDLLYGRLRPYLQKVAVAPSDGIAATELLVLRTRGPVEAEFLQEVLLGPDHHAQVTQLMSGARMPRIRAEQLLNLEILLPPQDAQRRIMRALSVLRHRIGAFRRRVRGALILAEQFEQALLGAAFDGRLSAVIRTAFDAKAGESLLADMAALRRGTWEDAKDSPVESDGQSIGNSYPEAATPDLIDQSVRLPSSWAWASLAEMGSAVAPICYGVVVPGEEIKKGVPLVRIQDLDAGGINPGRMRRISEATDHRYARSRLKGGEVLVSLVGTVVGKVARVPSDLAGANVARAIAKVTPVDPALQEWMALALETPALQSWLKGGARGVARNTLNLSRLARAPIPLAPVGERTWILEQLKRRRTSLLGLRGKLEDVTGELDSLWMNMRTRILDGAVVPADPGEDALRAARAESAAIEKGLQGGVRGKGRHVTANKLKSGDALPRRDLRAVLGEHPEGLEPLRLLEEAGYGLQDVEAFFKAVAEAIAAGQVREQRSAADWPVLVEV